jgi:hypothetical protein
MVGIMPFYDREILPCPRHEYATDVMLAELAQQPAVEGHFRDDIAEAALGYQENDFLTSINSGILPAVDYHNRIARITIKKKKSSKPDYLTGSLLCLGVGLLAYGLWSIVSHALQETPAMVSNPAIPTFISEPYPNRLKSATRWVRQTPEYLENKPAAPPLLPSSYLDYMRTSTQ